MEETNLRNFGTVTNTSGSHKLSLFYIAKGNDPKQDGYDFHSILWEEKIDDTWKQKIKITKKEFQNNSKYTKWVSELHSIDPENGQALIKVAEGNKPKDSIEIHYIYSWRKWDLLNNKEVSTLKICEEPYDAYDD